MKIVKVISLHATHISEVSHQFTLKKPICQVIKGSSAADSLISPIEIITAPLRGHVGDADIISDNLLSHTASGVL